MGSLIFIFAIVILLGLVLLSRPIQVAQYNHKRQTRRVEVTTPKTESIYDRYQIIRLGGGRVTYAENSSAGWIRCEKEWDYESLHRAYLYSKSGIERDLFAQMLEAIS